MSQSTKQVKVVAQAASAKQSFERVALFDEDGESIDLVGVLEDLEQRVHGLENPLENP